MRRTTREKSSLETDKPSTRSSARLGSPSLRLPKGLFPAEHASRCTTRHSRSSREQGRLEPREASHHIARLESRLAKDTRVALSRRRLTRRHTMRRGGRKKSKHREPSASLALFPFRPAVSGRAMRSKRKARRAPKRLAARSAQSLARNVALLLLRLIRIIPSSTRNASLVRCNACHALSVTAFSWLRREAYRRTRCARAPSQLDMKLNFHFSLAPLIYYLRNETCGIRAHPSLSLIAT